MSEVHHKRLAFAKDPQPNMLIMVLCLACHCSTRQLASGLIRSQWVQNKMLNPWVMYAEETLLLNEGWCNNKLVRELFLGFHGFMRKVALLPHWMQNSYDHGYIMFIAIQLEEFNKVCWVKLEAAVQHSLLEDSTCREQLPQSGCGGGVHHHNHFIPFWMGISNSEEWFF